MGRQGCQPNAKCLHPMALMSQPPPPPIGPRAVSRNDEGTSVVDGEEALEVGGAVRHFANRRMVVVKINKRFSVPRHRFPLEVKYEESSPWP